MKHKKMLWNSKQLGIVCINNTEINELFQIKIYEPEVFIKEGETEDQVSPIIGRCNEFNSKIQQWLSSNRQSII